MNVYIKVKYRIFGVTLKTFAYEVNIGGLREVPLSEIPIGYVDVFSMFGVTVYLPGEGFTILVPKKD